MKHINNVAYIIITSIKSMSKVSKTYNVVKPYLPHWISENGICTLRFSISRLNIPVQWFKSKTTSNVELVKSDSTQQDTRLQVLSRLQVRGYVISVNRSLTAAQSATCQKNHNITTPFYTSLTANIQMQKTPFIILQCTSSYSTSTSKSMFCYHCKIIHIIYICDW
jgi:hypothetical protein